MFSNLLKGLLILVVLAALVAGALQWRFSRQLKRMEMGLAEGRATVTARDDLPPQVVALAERQGVRRDALIAAVRFRQMGAMWPAPEAQAMPFKGSQVMVADEPSFVWTAKFAPFGLVTVVDYFIGGTGGLDGRLLGIYPLMRSIGGDEIAKGELMRYLAELPWHPDAILANRALYWQVIDEHTLKVAAGRGPARAEVTLRLNAEGFVETAEAPDRPRVDGKGVVAHKWRGYFSNYREMGGRTVPTAAEVAWVRDGQEFVYWRAVVDSWRIVGKR